MKQQVNKLGAERSQRRTIIGLAMQKIRADIHLREFVMLVFDATNGGITGNLTKSYQQLSEFPWGLCCSVSKVRRTVKKAKELGIVVSTDCEYPTNGQAPTAYKIDWVGVRNILGCELPPNSGV